MCSARCKGRRCGSGWLPGPVAGWTPPTAGPHRRRSWTRGPPLSGFMSVRAGCGDDLAVRAAANVSFDRGWTQATARACELVPEIAEHVHALAQDRRSRVQRRFRDDAVFGLAQPDELRYVNLHDPAANSLLDRPPRGPPPASGEDGTRHRDRRRAACARTCRQSMLFPRSGCSPAPVVRVELTQISLCCWSFGRSTRWGLSVPQARWASSLLPGPCAARCGLFFGGRKGAGAG
jgi:hypothetical protein